MKSKNVVKLFFALVAVLIAGVNADTPANCSYEDIKGNWVFHETARGNQKSINCSEKGFGKINFHLIL